MCGKRSHNTGDYATSMTAEREVGIDVRRLRVAVADTAIRLLRPGGLSARPRFFQ